jgi:hypothetical protein
VSVATVVGYAIRVSPTTSQEWVNAVHAIDCNRFSRMHNKVGLTHNGHRKKKLKLKIMAAPLENGNI